jgi:hypothetical protein
VLAAAGKGSHRYTNDILTRPDVLDFHTASAATSRDSKALLPSNGLQVTDTAQGAVIAALLTCGGVAMTIALIKRPAASLKALVARSFL